MIGAQLGSTLQRGIDDQVAVRDQQRVLALVAFAGPHKRLDEAFPDGRATVDGKVARHAQFGGALLDEVTLFIIDAAGVGEHGVHVVAALLQVRHAEAGIQAAGEGENDVFVAHGVRSTGMGIRADRWSAGILMRLREQPTNGRLYPCSI